MNSLQLIDIADELIILNKITIENLYRLENCVDCVGLYLLYYKLAKWQKTDSIKANDSYVQKCLKWGRKKISTTKQTLKDNGLIEIVQKRDSGKINGWFIKVHYVTSKDGFTSITVEQEVSKQEVLESTCGSQETIALRDNINCLKNKIKLLEEENNKLKSLLKEETKAVTPKFEKPSIEQIKNYCLERKNKVDAERFYDYYESNGWKVGRNPMKDWKATIRTWEKNSKQQEKTIKVYQERMIFQQDKARQEFLNGG